ncbi:MAG: S-layer homology domain-containing protein [Clostridiales bacterium]|jgi:hypothetical protein|nr:S-layer homology domain-containing protein [Clostridiales bacterium]
MNVWGAAKVSAVVLACFLIFGSSDVFAAVKYKDVSSSYWAYEAINYVSDRGLIVGDASGSFRPEALIDKFDTAKILAKAAGYKYTNATSEEQTYYNRAYSKNKSLLAKYAKTYSKWNSTADHEIAFLLEKQIFSVDDLDEFIAKDSSGNQQLRALSRQEAACFIVKLMGKSYEALKAKPGVEFKDDADISASFKPYVYYLKSLGIVTGDSSGNYFPNGAMVRASMSVILSKALDILSSETPAEPRIVSTSQDMSVNNVTSIEGTIEKFFPSFRGLQIATSDGKSSICQLKSSAVIYIGSFLKTYGDLAEGMQMSGVLLNNELIEIRASAPKISSGIIEIDDGKLADIKYSEGAAILVIESQDGAVSEYPAAESAAFLRNGGYASSLSSLKVGDNIDAQGEGGMLYKVQAIGVKSTVDGFIVEIHISPDKNTIVFSSIDNEIDEYLLNKEKVDVYSLRLGMKARLNLESKTVEAFALLEQNPEPSAVYTGYIQAISSTSLSISEGGDSAITSIGLQESTSYVDGSSEQSVSLDNLFVGMKVTVVLPSSGEPAQKVTIVSA